MIERGSVPGLVALFVALIVLLSYGVATLACDSRFESCKEKVSKDTIVRGEAKR